MSESNLYQSLKRSWNGYIKRMEPGLIGEGFPDCHMVHNKRDLFVELKFLSKEFKDKKLPIRNSQIIWFLEYEGSHAYFLFKVGNVNYLFSREQTLELKNKIKFDRFVEISIFKSKKIKEVVEYLKLLVC